MIRSKLITYTSSGILTHAYKRVKCIQSRPHHHLLTYIDSIKHILKPPVSNRLIFDGKKLKVMVVSGPNMRNDFHIEDGEELFYQITGDMDLDVIQGNEEEVVHGQSNAIRKRLPIKEGEMLLLPATVAHSPQRYVNTVGLVVERTRRSEEIDHLRWYKANADSDVLYQESFHCSDLGTQIREVIGRFRKLHPFTAAGTYTPVATSYVCLSNDHKHAPFLLSDRQKAHHSVGNSRVIDGREFKVDSWTTSGTIEYKHCDEVLAWQQSGSSQITVLSNSNITTSTVVLTAGEVALIDCCSSSSLCIKQIGNEKNSLLTIVNDKIMQE